ncbi:MAG TPA: hypothetical protein VFJ16_06440, partial [Longimicrobium sp.]|nr:hypothetical protein [Longimicrobium sp.]
MPDPTTTTTSDAPAAETLDPRRRVRGKFATGPRVARWAWAALACLPLLAAPWVSRALIPGPPGFDSDRAIPVLMVRAREWSLFDAYYWGQDRLGAWPLLLLRAASQLSGQVFDYTTLHRVATAWVLLGAVVMARLAGRWGVAAGGLLAAILVGNPDSRAILFDAAHPYGWQLTSLLLAWWGLRRLAEWPGTRARGRWRLRAATSFAAFLAQAMSPLSAPLLVIVAAVEAVRARLLDAGQGRSAPRRWAEGALVVGAAGVAERVLRAAYHAYTRARYGEEYRTFMTIDWGRLGANAREVANLLARSASMPLLVVATVGAVAAVAVLWRARGGRVPAWRVEGAALVLACWAISAAQVPVLFLLRHVRMNRFSVRYFSIGFVFGTLAAALAVVCLAASLPWLSRRWRPVLALAGAAGLATAVLRLPPAPKPRADAPAGLAARLQARAPGAPLLAGYWSTYVLAAHQRPQTMLEPVPCEGRQVRAPWWAADLPRHRWVVVGHTYECPDAGPADSAAPWVYQYGVLLRLVRADWESGAAFHVSLYENATARAVAHTEAPAAAAWRYCDAGAALRVGFAARERAEVMVARVVRSPDAVLLAAPVFADGRVGRPAPMRRTGRLHRAELRAAGA